VLPHQLELLAPARDADIGIAAVDHGADAVYIGGPSFGARASAANEIDAIARLVEHAHRYHARVFVTLNTILADNELEPAAAQIRDLHGIGVDALIVQDMGLLELDLPPIQLHASTQCDIRTPEKAAFLQDAGLSQIVLARELDLGQIAAIRAATRPETTLEFFVHGALCVAYSGQCYLSHAHTGRSANRGDCSQACRLPYQVVDSHGGIVAHDKHVLSMKDNNQSENLEALVDAGIRSFKIEGRYKDQGYVKNITAHYRTLLDELIVRRPEFARGSSGRTTLSFTPDPNQNFNREFTDYFVDGRKTDIGAFDTPKNPGLPIGHVARVDKPGGWIELDTTDAATALNNGDGLCYYTLRKELAGLAINTAEQIGEHRWRVVPKDALASLRDLRVGTEVNRNRDMAWLRMMEKPSSERRIGVWAALSETEEGFALTLTDEDGCIGRAEVAHPHEPAKNDPVPALRANLAKFGTTIFEPIDITLDLAGAWFLPASLVNHLRRDAVLALEASREAARERPPRAAAVEPPVAYPEDTLTYLANVANHKARDFYAKHGVKVIAAAYEAHEEAGEVSLMITKHCVRYSLSLCPKQTRGVTGVHGTVRAEPLTLINGSEKLTLRFDCKPCEMHVVGKLKPAVARVESPLVFYKTRP